MMSHLLPNETNAHHFGVCSGVVPNTFLSLPVRHMPCARNSLTFLTNVGKSGAYRWQICIKNELFVGCASATLSMGREQTVIYTFLILQSPIYVNLI